MAAAQVPIVWVLQGLKAGDNAQARELARRLGHAAVVKPLRYNWLHHLPNILAGASIAHVRSEQKRELRPPWPKLVICAGKRAVPVALWIKKQSRGYAKIVHLGRPRVPLDWIDLVITTPQYGLPLAGNVIERPVPFVTPATPSETELAGWRRQFCHLPRPWTGVLVGGSVFPIYLDDKAIARLATRIRTAQEERGAVLVSTSPRTGVSAARKLTQLIPPPAYLHVFGEGDNPHHAILALADRFIVTSDSVSMLAEAAGTGKPIEIFELPRSKLAVSWEARRGLGGWLARNGIISPPRDLRKLSRQGQSLDDEAIFHRIEELMAKP
jgi:mitochondrial fission protein ELM1